MTKGFGLKLEWHIELRDKNGKLLYTKRGISKSLLRNFMYWLQSKFQMTASDSQSTWTAPDTGNIARSFVPADARKEGWFGWFGALITISLTGLRVGKGNNAVLPTDYELQTLIPHGVAQDQMQYGGQTYEVVTVVGQNTTFRITRAFTNSSGLTITIKEIGAVFAQNDNTAALRYLCYLRDVLPSPVAVPDGSTFTLRYTFSVTS